MKAKQAVKHFTLVSMMAVGITACSSTQDIEEQPTQAPVIVEPVIEEKINEEQEEVISSVINNGVIDIPVLEDAQIFAEFSDSLPAVINYFTSSSEAQVIEFYQQAFGLAQSQERKRDRLTLKYQQGEEKMRVVISQQNNKRQVDVIIESDM
ncbi:hypothetical protein [Colwellia psychrerythraea]|uniref:Lipoprotein n=1 Tax=Colwellia psychrerythraea TaxID=28229 RepID=A0A099L2K0_COLPS|nr:hypothetical protein [Colwellia psychrerythraea]KGJ96083.1 hypothetical protein GAB14E_0030 [Colwellia psychrerythraea]